MLPVQRYRLPGVPGTLDSLGGKHEITQVKAQIQAQVKVAKGRSKRSVLKLKTKPKHKSEDEIGRFTPSDWSNREKEAQETDWARLRF